jgi:hypothetical protein
MRQRWLLIPIEHYMVFCIGRNRVSPDHPTPIRSPCTTSVAQSRDESFADSRRLSSVSATSESVCSSKNLSDSTGARLPPGCGWRHDEGSPQGACSDRNRVSVDYLTPIRTPCTISVAQSRDTSTAASRRQSSVSATSESTCSSKSSSDFAGVRRELPSIVQI